MSIDWKDLTERAGWTFAQAVAGVITAGGSAAAFGSFDWRSVLLGAAASTGASVFKGLMKALGSSPTETALVEQVVEAAVEEILAAHHAAPVPAPPAPLAGEVPVAAIAQTTALRTVPRPLDPAAVSARGGR